jgi:hypothetical protein
MLVGYDSPTTAVERQTTSSDRTIAALQQAKARGIALGAANPRRRNLRDAARIAGLRSTQPNARDAYGAAGPKIATLRRASSSFAQIAAARLNGDGERRAPGSSGTQYRCAACRSSLICRSRG